MQHIAALFCGLLFGGGLAASGMTDTAKVIGFLDIFGTWDPDLMVVMAAAVLTTLITFRLVLARNNPLFSPDFHLPTSSMIDAKLLSGAALFGLGWGLYGYCPGPAVAATFYGETETFVFIAAMLAGMFVSDRLVNKLNAEKG